MALEQMRPYYDQDGIVIYHGDCREICDSVYGDLLCTDPPYGISYKGGSGGNLIHSKGKRRQEKVIGDDQPFDPAPFLPNPYVALFGAQHFYDRLPPGGTFHIWDKRADYEPVHTADFDTVWVNRKEVSRKFRCVWRGLCRETEHMEMIVHPTQKPIVVMLWVLEMFPSARSVLDPFMGSGTTLVAAKNLGRKAIGIEIEEKYCEIAAKRLAQGVLAL